MTTKRPEAGREAQTGPDSAAQPQAGERTAELHHYEQTAAAFVERFAADLTEAGMQRMAARVFACLLSSEEGSLSSAQIGERLRVSPAAVSGAVRYLAQVHMVSREREPGSRRERYRVQEDVWYQALLDRDRLLGRFTATLRSGERNLGTDTPAGRRVRETGDFLEFMREELGSMLDRWHAHRAAHDGEG